MCFMAVLSGVLNVSKGLASGYSGYLDGEWKHCIAADAMITT